MRAFWIFSEITSGFDLPIANTRTRSPLFANLVRKGDVLQEFEKMHTLILDYNDLDVSVNWKLPHQRYFVLLFCILLSVF